MKSNDESELLERIIDIPKVLDFASDEHERVFRYCLTLVKMKARRFDDGDRFGLRMRPENIGNFKLKVGTHALSHCARTNEIVTWLDGGEDRMIEFVHRRRK